jgi:mRNA interferase RelE/StbE
MYKIEFTNSAARELRDLPGELQRRIALMIDRLASDPRPHGVRKLAGHELLYRVKVGQYRLIYEIDDKKAAIKITRVRHRRDAYR